MSVLRAAIRSALALPVLWRYIRLPHRRYGPR